MNLTIIEALKSEALTAGDYALADACREALAGSDCAYALCRDACLSAAAADDDPAVYAAALAVWSV